MTKNKLVKKARQKPRIRKAKSKKPRAVTYARLTAKRCLDCRTLHTADLCPYCGSAQMVTVSEARPFNLRCLSCNAGYRISSPRVAWAMGWKDITELTLRSLARGGSHLHLVSDITHFGRCPKHQGKKYPDPNLFPPPKKAGATKL